MGEVTPFLPAVDSELDTKKLRGVLQASVNPSLRTDAVYVVHTTIDDTLAAARVATRCASALGVPVTVVHCRAVPYAVAVDRPVGLSPIETEEFRERLQAEGLSVRLRVCLCRSRRHTLPRVIPRRSLIVIAGRRRWWRTRVERIQSILEAAGHLVIFKETSHA